MKKEMVARKGSLRIIISILNDWREREREREREKVSSAKNAPWAFVIPTH